LLADYDHLGYNYRMTDLQGSLGSVQMDRAQWVLGERSRLARRYDELLADVAWLKTPAVPQGFTHGYQAYVCLFRPETPTSGNVELLREQRNALMRSLEEKGIATRQGTHAPVLTGYYARKYGLRSRDFPNACLAEHLSLTLPLYPQMTDSELEWVVQALKASFEQKG
jgi:dTDP-4-amino-4,6-dideoxygalactose transaminase